MSKNTKHMQLQKKISIITRLGQLHSSELRGGEEDKQYGIGKIKVNDISK